MANVKCVYQRFVCTSQNDFDVTGDCYTCKADIELNDGVCPSLELRPGYIEKKCKSVEFDGESLYVGGKWVCSIDQFDYPKTDDTYIIDLEIDGKVFVKDGEIVE